MNSVMGTLPFDIVPEGVARAMVRLEMALERETDYREAQVRFRLNDNSVQPSLSFIADASD